MNMPPRWSWLSSADVRPRTLLVSMRPLIWRSNRWMRSVAPDTSACSAAVRFSRPWLVALATTAFAAARVVVRWSRSSSMVVMGAPAGVHVRACSQ